MRMSHHVLIACWLITALAASPAVAKNWPQFRGPTGQGHSSATGVPVEWGATKNVAWKVPVPGHGWSSPVLLGGRVYLTTAVAEAGGPVSLRALCFDAADGKSVWDVEVFKPDPASRTRKAMGSW
jgi:outer membrane protein assembly factor BamB